MSIRLGAFDEDPGIRPQLRQFTAYAASWSRSPPTAFLAIPRAPGRTSPLQGTPRMEAIDHPDLVVTSQERSIAFYRGLLAPLGYVQLAEIEVSAGSGSST